MEELKNCVESPVRLSAQVPMVLETYVVPLAIQDMESHQKETQRDDQSKIEVGLEQKGRRLTPEDWHRRYLKYTDSLNDFEKAVLESLRPFIRKGIDLGFKSDRLEEYWGFEEFKERYEIELLMKFTTEIRYQAKLLTKWAKRLALIRKPSAGNALIRQRESIQANALRVSIERDEEGEIIEIGQPEAQWWPLNPPSAFCCNPEEYYINVETYKMVQQFEEVIQSSEKKQRDKYSRVFQEIKNGHEVGKKNAMRFGVEPAKVASIGYQMRTILQDYVAGLDEEVAQRLKAIQELRKKKREETKNGKEQGKKRCKRSTFNERKAQYRDPSATEYQQKTKRNCSVIRGRKDKKPKPVQALLPPP